MKAKKPTGPLQYVAFLQAVFGSYRIVESAEMRRAVDETLVALGGPEAEALRKRFGLDGQPARLLREVGAELGYTRRERVRQGIERGLRSLRHPRYARRLHAFVTDEQDGIA